MSASARESKKNVPNLWKTSGCPGFSSLCKFNDATPQCRRAPSSGCSTRRRRRCWRAWSASRSAAEHKLRSRHRALCLLSRSRLPPLPERRRLSTPDLAAVLRRPAHARTDHHARRLAIVLPPYKPARLRLTVHCTVRDRRRHRKLVRPLRRCAPPGSGRHARTHRAPAVHPPRIPPSARQQHAHARAPTMRSQAQRAGAGGPAAAAAARARSPGSGGSGQGCTFAVAGSGYGHHRRARRDEGGGADRRDFAQTLRRGPARAAPRSSRSSHQHRGAAGDAAAAAGGGGAAERRDFAQMAISGGRAISASISASSGLRGATSARGGRTGAVASSGHCGGPTSGGVGGGGGGGPTLGGGGGGGGGGVILVGGGQARFPTSPYELPTSLPCLLTVWLYCTAHCRRHPFPSSDPEPAPNRGSTVLRTATAGATRVDGYLLAGGRVLRRGGLRGLTLPLPVTLTLTLALALTRNPNPDQAISADLVGELVYFDGDLVAVNSHTPHAGPRVGGTVIELHGQARPMSM